jgi:hypothetical protein
MCKYCTCTQRAHFFPSGLEFAQGLFPVFDFTSRVSSREMGEKYEGGEGDIVFRKICTERTL